MQKLSLDGVWQLECLDYGEGVKKRFHRADYEPQNPVEAHVPGEVHFDLMRAGIIKEPLDRENAKKQAWIEDKEFWYKRKFTFSPELEGERIELVFHGLDLNSDIYLNREKIAEHHNMHTPCVIDVTEKLEEENTLVVRVDCGIKSTEGKSIQPYPGRESQDYRRVWTRKAQFTYGWDWAPRLLNCGIWRSVEVVSYEKVALRDVFIYPELSSDYKRATLHVSGLLENFTGKEFTIDMEAMLKSRAGGSSYTSPYTIFPGLNKIKMSFQIDNPHLWWPQHLGDPFMYDFCLRASEEDHLLDEFSLPVGIREISLLQELLPEDEGTSFTIQVNGVRVFCKGADWVPADSIIARVDKEKYEKLIGMAKEANFNMLRIWGGGIYEAPYFYELCARNGIMVWQDFMFACAYYPNDPEFLQEAEKEIETVLKRLRNYTSIIIWCGNNELQWLHQRNLKEDPTLEFIDFSIYHEIIPRLCASLDPTRPYWFSSPYGGEDPCSEMEGNRHAWTISLGREEVDKLDYKLYSKDKGKFITEFGILSCIDKKSLQGFTPEEELSIDSPIQKFHNNRFEGGNIRNMLQKYYRDPESLSFEEYLKFSMLIQAEALKYALDHWRRRKFFTSGSLFWMYNDCWGATGSWTIVDYYLRRKPSFYFVKRSFSSINVSFKELKGGLSIYGLNDTLDDFTGYLEWGLSSFSGKRREEHGKSIIIPANTSEKFTEVRFSHLKEEEKRSVFYWVSLWEEGRLKAKDRHFFTTFGNLDLPPARVEYEVVRQGERRYQIKLTSDKFAWFLRLAINNHALFSDNYFDLFPREVKEVTVENITDDDIKLLSIEWNNK